MKKRENDYWLKFENWPLEIYIRIIKHYTDIDPTVNTRHCISCIQGSPNQAKWATFSSWFQWNLPIYVKKRSFSRPVSLFKSVFFSPKIILFLQYSCKRSSHVPEILPKQGLNQDVQYFIPNSLIASILRSLCSTFVLWKVGGHVVVGKETLKIW
jgi:hypothetical protein